MDDISLQVGLQISKAVEKIVEKSIIVDTHNCIGELKESVYEDSTLIPEMIDGAVKATQQALKAKRGQPRLGVASNPMKEFSPIQGMGPEGITVTVIEVMGQTMAYVLIDGNNMVVGLREKIHQELISHHVNAAEILTTDTHEVTAISTKGEGYSPIGLDIPHASIIQAIRKLVEEAKSRLQPVQVAVHVGETEPLHVMGEGTVETIAQLVPLSAKVAKRVAITVFLGAFIISLPLLALI
jgi:putative membrane protein